MIYDISYEAFMGAKPLRIRLDEIDGFIKIYDGIRYLVLFCPGWYDEIYNNIRDALQVVLQIVLIIISQNQN